MAGSDTAQTFLSAFASSSHFAYASLVGLIVLVGNGLVFVLRTLRPKAFPPGPRGLPGLGNVLQLNRTWPFLTYGAWAKRYGADTPLGVKLGAKNVVVLNSGRAVRELIEKRGAIYSDRPFFYMQNEYIFKHDLKPAIFQNYGPWLTRWRKEFTIFFGPQAIARLSPVYEAEAARLLVKMVEAMVKSPTGSLKGQHLEPFLMRWTISVPCLGVCGQRPDEDSLGRYGFDIAAFKRCSDEFSDLIKPNAAELFPILRRVPEFMGMARWKERARNVREHCFKTGRQFISAAKDQRAALDGGKPIEWESILAKMLREQRDADASGGHKDGSPEAYTTAEMGHTGFHIVASATASSLAVMSTMLLLLAKYPDMQDRIRDEMLTASGGGPPRASQVAGWRFTEAFWNEMHRWRPVTPAGIPHAAAKDDVYEGHVIPKGTATLINVWNIHHAEEDYEHPERFDPERFLRHPFGMRLDEAHDPARLEAASARVTWDFGAGRRICPGRHVAKQNLLLGLAGILWAFDVVPPPEAEGGVDAIDLSLERGFVQEIALTPKTLNFSLRLREGRTAQEIMDHYAGAYEGEAKVMGWEDGRFKW